MTSNAWDAHAANYQTKARLSTTDLHYGFDLPGEDQLHLVGDVRGKRVLELGCGAGQNAIVLTKQGATVIGIDSSSAQLQLARNLAEQQEVKVEFRQADMSDLAMIPADTIDFVLSVNALHYVEDLGRLLRQVDRVMKTSAPFVFSMRHPSWHLLGANGGDKIMLSYFAEGPVREVTDDGVELVHYHHTFATILTALRSAGLRVETLLEPQAPSGVPRTNMWQDGRDFVPRNLIIRARKDGR